MKIIIFIHLTIIFLFFVGCNQKEHSNIEQKSDIMTTQSFGTEDSIIFNDLKNFISPFLKTRSCDVNNFDRVLSESENYSWVRIPYFRLEENGFYEAPSPERIFSCLSALEDEVVFEGTDKSGNKIRLVAYKKNDHWLPKTLIENWGEVVSWLPEKLKQADHPFYQVFEFSNSEFIVLYKDQKPIIYDLGGLEQEQHCLCESFTNMINIKKQNDKVLF